jgi:predicted HNH restriction endonuclease
VHHIRGFNEVSRIEGVNQEEADYEIDNYKNAVAVCVYHHKLLHKHKDGFTYDAIQKYFVSRDKSTKILLVLNKHL